MFSDRSDRPDRRGRGPGGGDDRPPREKRPVEVISELYAKAGRFLIDNPRVPVERAVDMTEILGAMKSKDLPGAYSQVIGIARIAMHNIPSSRSSEVSKKAHRTALHALSSAVRREIVTRYRDGEAELDPRAINDRIATELGRDALGGATRPGIADSIATYHVPDLRPETTDGPRRAADKAALRAEVFESIALMHGEPLLQDSSIADVTFTPDDLRRR